MARWADTEVRFWSKVAKAPPTDCWLWLGAIGAGRVGQRYGMFSGAGTRYAHRYSYILAYGEIPHGLTIDHICRERLCVNPRHLEAVTQDENKRRGESPPAVNARKTHCSRGHLLSSDNLRKAQGRMCATCARLHDRSRRTDPHRQAQAYQSFLRNKSARNTRRRERYASDPNYRERRLATNTAWRRRSKEQDNAR